MMKRAGVTIRLNDTMDVEKVHQLEPDAVIVATGAVPYIPYITGLDRARAATYLDVLSGALNVEDRNVVIVGGKLIGTQVAEFISTRGGKAILTEPSEALCQDAGARTKWLLLQRVNENPDISVHLNSTVENISENQVVVQSKGDLETIGGVDLVVICFGAISANHLSDELKFQARIPKIYTVGDCVYPRKMTEAIYEGFATALGI